MGQELIVYTKRKFSRENLARPYFFSIQKASIVFRHDGPFF
jgi:hypothetical protein